MSKKSCFRGCFDKQYGRPAQALLRLVSRHLYHIHWSLARKLCSKKYVLLTSKFLRLLIKTLTTDEKYPVLNRENLTIPFQMQLFQKQKTFSQFFAALLKSRLNFKTFESKDDSHRFFFF